MSISLNLALNFPMGNIVLQVELNILQRRHRGLLKLVLVRAINSRDELFTCSSL